MAETKVNVRERLGLGGNSGYHARMARENHRKRVAMVGEMFARATHGDAFARLNFQHLMGGRAPQGRAHEAISTSDFPILFGDFLNRTLGARYAAAAPVWRRFASRQVNPDFRGTKVINFLGGGAVLERVPELDEFPARGFDESEFSTFLAKFGARIQWSWEASVNDDLGAFRQAPAALSRGAVNTEDYVATSVLVDAAGPNATLFPSPDNKPLTRDNLEAALQLITNKSDEDGNPIDVGTPVLVVPTALVLTAQNIVNVTEIRRTASSVESLTSGNGLSRTPEVVENRWLTAINKDAKAPTSWFLLPEPNTARPAVIETFLSGYETPDLRVKADAGMSLGGQSIDPTEGSFERDDVQYRIRHVVEGNVGYTDAVYASEGS